MNRGELIKQLAVAITDAIADQSDGRAVLDALAIVAAANCSDMKIPQSEFIERFYRACDACYS